MTFFVNARFLTQPLSGVQRYAAEIMNGIDRLLDQQDLRQALGPIVAYAPAGVRRAPKWKHIELRILAGRSGHLWEQTTLLRATREGVLLSLGNAGPVSHPNQILVLHDANIWAIPEAFNNSYRMLHRAMRPVLARRAKQLITVSAFSARELARHLDLKPDQFAVVPNGCEHITDVEPDDSVLTLHGLKHGKYLLSVGNQSPNKNLMRLIEAHQNAGPEVPPLAIVGGVAPGVVAQTVQDASRVLSLGRVSDGSLRALYEGARGFAFPSLYEGFGIPPLEAMQLGVPVLCAHRAAMPEILGDAPIWFDPMDGPGMTTALEGFSQLEGTGLSMMIDAGDRVAKNFTWDGAARLMAQHLLAAIGAPANLVQAAPHHDPGLRQLAERRRA